MSLPTKLSTDTVELHGTDIAIRSLSRAEAIRLGEFRDDVAAAEVFILTCGTGVSEDEARAFREGNGVDDAGKLVDAILILSRLATPETAARAREGDGSTDPDPLAHRNGSNESSSTVLVTASITGSPSGSDDST
jgi:hypothetical protein